MNQNFVTNDSIKLLALAFLLLLPAYYYIAGLNITYLYPILLIIFYIIGNNGKVMRLEKTGNTLFWLYLSYLCIVAFLQRGIFYGIASTASTIGILYLVLAMVSSRDKLFQFIDAVTLIVFTGCVLGIFESITSINIFQMFSNSGLSFFKDFRLGHIRIACQFAQPIVYGFYLMLTSPLILYSVANNSENKRGFAKVTYVLMWINVFLTVSRAPMIVFFLLQLLFLYKLGHSKFVLRTLGVILILLFLILIDQFWGFGISQYVEKIWGLFSAVFGENSSETYSGVGNRFEIIQWVKETVDTDIWFGKGIDAKFSYAVHEWQIKESIENEYLNTFFHYGIVGMVVQILAFIGNIIYARKVTKRSIYVDETFNLANAIMWCLIAFYIVIITAGQSSAITMHIILIGVLIVYDKIGKDQAYYELDYEEN